MRQQIVRPATEDHGGPHHHQGIGPLAPVLYLAQGAGAYVQQWRQLLLGEAALLAVAPETVTYMLHTPK